MKKCILLKINCNAVKLPKENMVKLPSEIYYPCFFPNCFQTGLQGNQQNQAGTSFYHKCSTWQDIHVSCIPEIFPVV